MTSERHNFTRRSALRSVAAGAGTLGTVGMWSQTAVDRVAAGSGPDWAESWADEYRYTHNDSDDLDASINNTFGVTQMGKGTIEGVGCVEEEHYVYRFLVYGIGAASAEDGGGVTSANFIEGHSLSLDANDICGDNATIEPFEHYDVLAETSEFDDLMAKDHYKEGENLDDYDEVKYWCDEWANDHDDVDKTEDFADWNTAISGVSLAVGVIGTATGGTGWGIAGITLGAVSVLDSVVGIGRRRQYSETNTSFEVSESDSYRPHAMHYLDFRAYVPPDETLEIDVNQEIDFHDQSGGGHELESNIDNTACYEISVPTMDPPSEQGEPYDANVVTCENQRERQ